ncbi:acetyltransferase, ribosomal protein N-acetylase [Leptolyngbya sp. PCC 7375]|nr:acetyltransferase, ribosomal protein N-acetylase [Leptolyngbya sp. PCC 7375]
MQIETQRLILRNFRPEDFEQLAPILADPQGMKYSRTGNVLSVLETQAKIQGYINSYQKHGFGKWAIILKEHNQLIGYCGIAVELVDNKLERELGYRLDHNFWNQGLATEAAKAAIQYGFEQLKLPYILGIVERQNKASVRVLEKLGMQYQRKTVFYGVKMDVYSVTSQIP